VIPPGFVCKYITAVAGQYEYRTDDTPEFSFAIQLFTNRTHKLKTKCIGLPMNHREYRITSVTDELRLTK